MQNRSDSSLTDELHERTQRWKTQVVGIRVVKLKCKKTKYWEAALALMDINERNHTFQLSADKLSLVKLN
jgi:hypothetical protein